MNNKPLRKEFEVSNNSLTELNPPFNWSTYMVENVNPNDKINVDFKINNANERDSFMLSFEGQANSDQSQINLNFIDSSFTHQIFVKDFENVKITNTGKIATVDIGSVTQNAKHLSLEGSIYNIEGHISFNNEDDLTIDASKSAGIYSVVESVHEKIITIKGSIQNSNVIHGTGYETIIHAGSIEGEDELYLGLHKTTIHLRDSGNKTEIYMPVGKENSENLITGFKTGKEGDTINLQYGFDAIGNENSHYNNIEMINSCEGNTKILTNKDGFSLYAQQNGENAQIFIHSNENGTLSPEYDLLAVELAGLDVNDLTEGNISFF